MSFMKSVSNPSCAIGCICKNEHSEFFNNTRDEGIGHLQYENPEPCYASQTKLTVL